MAKNCGSVERRSFVQHAVHLLDAPEPSPTAAATRLTLPQRTSPTANMPGMLVSKNSGWRPFFHFAAGKSSLRRSGSRAHESFVIERNTGIQPGRAGQRAGHEKHVAVWHVFRGASPAVFQVTPSS